MMITQLYYVGFSLLNIIILYFMFVILKVNYYCIVIL